MFRRAPAPKSPLSRVWLPLETCFGRMRRQRMAPELEKLSVRISAERPIGGSGTRRACEAGEAWPPTVYVGGCRPACEAA